MLHVSDISKGCGYSSQQDRHDLCPQGAYLLLGENDHQTNKVISDLGWGTCNEEANRMIRYVCRLNLSLSMGSLLVKVLQESLSVGTGYEKNK